MAAKKFNKEQLSRGKSILNPDDNFNPDDFTYDVITGFEKNPQKEELPKVIEVIKKDTSLPDVQKEVLINRLKEDFVTLFSFNNVPEDYSSLKFESKFLADLTHYSFASLAVRLKKIRDEELYREDKYSNFKSFVDCELSINRTTAYNYIDLVTYFDVQTFEHVSEPSKLIPALPLLKSASINKDIPVSKIKKDIVKQSQTMSARELNDHIKELKMEYGISKPSESATAAKSSAKPAVKDYSKKISRVGDDIKKTITEYKRLHTKYLKAAEKAKAKNNKDDEFVNLQRAYIYSDVISRLQFFSRNLEGVLKD